MSVTTRNPVCPECLSDDVCIVQELEEHHLIDLHQDKEDLYVVYANIISTHPSSSAFIRCHDCLEEYSFDKFVDLYKSLLEANSA